jgi:nucleoid DNA-binding protein
LEVRQREARTETMQIAASKKVAFRPAKELKDAV